MFVHAERREFIHPLPCTGAAMHHPRTFAAELQQDFTEGPRQLRIKHADELVVRPARIQQRSQHVENRALPFGGEQLPRLRHRLERRMIQRRKKEAEPDALDARDHTFLRQVDLDAQRLQHIRATCLGGDAAIAVLRHAHASRREDEHRRARHIEEMQLVSACADDIEHWSRQFPTINARIDRQFQKRLHKRRNLRRRLTLLGQRTQKISLHSRRNRRIDQRRRRFGDLGVVEVGSGLQCGGQCFHAPIQSSNSKP
jgi:hypothetical protein